MPRIELGPARPVGAIDVRNARIAGGHGERPAKTEKSAAPLVKSDALDPACRRSIANGSN